MTVGNSDDISANLSCGGTITSSAIFECGLKGTVIGIKQNNTEDQHLMEVRAYPWKNIASSATTQNDSGCHNTNCTDFGAEKAIQLASGWNRNVSAVT